MSVGNASGHWDSHASGYFVCCVVLGSWFLLIVCGLLWWLVPADCLLFVVVVCTLLFVVCGLFMFVSCLRLAVCYVCFCAVVCECFRGQHGLPNTADWA